MSSGDILFPSGRGRRRTVLQGQSPCSVHEVHRRLLRLGLLLGLAQVSSKFSRAAFMMIVIIIL